MEKHQLNRRSWLKLGLGLAAGSIAAPGCYMISKEAADKAAYCQLSPRQELGPFPPMKALTQSDHDVDLTAIRGQTGKALGEVVKVKGRVLDGNCRPVAGAIVVIWQSNHHGRYHHEYDNSPAEMDPNFQGWGQAITNEQGAYQFKTILPGLYGRRTRHIHFKISKRGYHEMVTQMYFEGEERNQTDGLLNQLTHEEQQRVTCKLEELEGMPTATFDINIEKLKEGTVPEKVLAEYTGRYHFQLKEEDGFLKWLRSMDIKENPIWADIHAEGDQLFITMSFAPKAEVFWKAKDTFDAVAFYRSTLIFQRNDMGKVERLALKSGGEDDLIAVKIDS
jgi:protocatechuate 3,4-dioxygenase beta subunit